MYLGKGFDHYLEKNQEVGFIETLNYPMVGVSGLPKTFIGEVIIFESGSLGLVMSLDENIAQVLLLDNINFRVGERVARTGQTMQVNAHEKLLGGAYDSLGKSITTRKEDGGFSISPVSKENSRLMPVFRGAPDFFERAKVSDPLITGVSIVDLMIPLGKGQRELVLGDKKTGKTSFLLQVILSQARRDSICIYAGIGKAKGEILDIIEFSKEEGIEDSFISVNTSSSDSPGKIYLTPYTAMAYAEYFKDAGHDVVVIMDNMSTHAEYYREMSLIAGAFPGRSSYPGDIFFIHSQLFERAGNFKHGEDTSSITCLPVADTVESDISGYIQTNLMSMTDGHLFFDSSFFDEGRRPAVNPYLSVTRVGKQVQTSLHHSLNRELSGFLTLLRKHQRFVHFGAELSEGIKTSLETGEKITAFFKQAPRKILPLNVQYLFFTLIWGGVLTNKQIKSFDVLGDKMTELYQTDEDFKKYVDDLVNNNSDFNNLLSNVMKEQESIKELLGIEI